MTDVKEYAKALFEITEEAATSDSVLESFLAVKQLFTDNPDYAKLLDTPAVAVGEKLALIDESLGGADEMLVNLIKILTEKRLAHTVPRCADEYVKLYEASRKIETAVAVTTVPLADAQISALTAKLEKITGKTVKLVNEIDPKLIGGIKVRVSGTQYDGSIKSRLDAFKKSLEKITV